MRTNRDVYARARANDRFHAALRFADLPISSASRLSDDFLPELTRDSFGRSGTGVFPRLNTVSEVFAVLLHDRISRDEVISSALQIWRAEFFMLHRI